MFRSIVWLFCIACLAQAGEPVLLDELTVRDGLSYWQSRTQPYSGLANRYHADGQLATQASFRDGLRHGKETAWYEDGKLRYVVRYKKGEPKSLGSSWYPRVKPDRRQESMDCIQASGSTGNSVDSCAVVEGERALQFISCILSKETGEAGSPDPCAGIKVEPDSTMGFCSPADCDLP